MADKKISQLTSATTPLSGSEVLPIVQSGSTVKVPVSSLTAGRAVTVGTLATSTTNSADNVTFESTTNSGIYARWKRPDKTYILSLDINNNGGKNFSVFDETAGATRLDISDAGNVSVSTGNLVIGTAGKGITTGGATALGLGVNGAVDAVTIDANNRMLVGQTSSFTVGGLSQWGRFQMIGNAFNGFGQAVLALGRGEAATAITADETLGVVTFSDNAGNTFASIESAADAAAGANNYPGRVTISTTPDSGTDPVERVRVKSGGQVRFVPLAAAPANAEAGDVYYDSGTNKLRCYDGTAWNDLF